MQKYWLNRWVQWGLMGLLAEGGAIALPSLTVAQVSNIVPDNTLLTPQADERSVVIQNFQGFPAEVIVGGARRGANLFHSFREFNVAVGRGAYFGNLDSALQTILARVTGSNRSEILGTLGILNAAGVTSRPNLFLINPHGIIFGPNASLDVEGSFVATTANAIQFGDRGNFSASVPESPAPLLTVTPSAFLFNQFVQQGGNAIESRALLEVPDGQSLLLLGGNIAPTPAATGNILLEGNGILGTTGLAASGGRVEVGSVGSAGAIELTSNDNQLSFQIADTTPRADISLTNAALINVGASRGGGDVVLDGRNITLTEGSLIGAGILRGGNSADSRAGDIRINATGNLGLEDGSVITNQVTRNAVGQGGNVTVIATNLFVRDGSQLTASIFGKGRAGNLMITVHDTASFDGQNRDETAASGAGSSVNRDAVGDGGNFSLTTGNLFLTNGAQLSAKTAGQGRAGNLTITVRGTASFDGQNQHGTASSGAFSRVEPGAVGDGGNFSLTAGNLFVTNGAQLNASTFGRGSAGNLTITAHDTASFDGTDRDGTASSGIFSRVNPDAVGNGGDLSLTAENLFVTNGAQLSTGTSGRGSAGNLTITIHNTASFDGESQDRTVSSGANSGVNPGAVGDGGDLSLTAENLFVTNGAQLSTSTSGRGRAGNLTITIYNTASFDGESQDRTVSGANSGVNLRAVGDGGDLSLTAGDLFVTNGAQLVTGTFGWGRAGNLTITVRDTAVFDGIDRDGTASSGAFSSVELGAVGDGGDLSLTAGNLFVTNEAQLSASSFGQGRAGNLLVHVRDTLQADNGTFSTIALQSSGGAIALTAKTIRLLGDSDITTSVFSGVGGGGNITLTADSIIALGDSDILAFAQDGVGGNITLNTPAFFGQNYRPAPFGTDPRTLDGNNRVDINASGTVSGIITLPDVSLIQNSLTQLSQTVIDTNALLASSCIDRTHQPTGSFYITGSGGLPLRPGDAPTSSFPTGAIRNVEKAEGMSQELGARSQESESLPPSTPHPWKLGDPIAEPQGVYQLPNGQLVLSRECEN
ncbi:filamentous hemagglutinin N-terminal domain-containing protein [Kovacikia minuta CCNUW1]|uniref:two-partner secretion domain-containing protein n=1 Tax=Kovacikia minuta TaxID=2931930 RepID=UPI001CCB9366|nr:filamentous hemagglutinin N-terminal domain-containing protein [Kovacikia minuta]UBF24872.1 filamentous hemagglutinin N-terminal domain-containing protein [Kovacikia minuta CCNUW1]